MTQLQISITPEILARTKYCGFVKGKMQQGKHCAIAEAIRDIFQEAYVGGDCIVFDFSETSTDLPCEAVEFIGRFDRALPDERINLSPFTFSISIPDALIDRINIDEVTELLNNHPTLKLV